jgi:hypothetical protein
MSQLFSLLPSQSIPDFLRLRLMTTKQIRIRLTIDELNELTKLADSCDLNPTALSAVFVKAAMRAAEENDGRLVLPLRFKVDLQPPTPKKK